jgi:hypothetical protein
LAIRGILGFLYHSHEVIIMEVNEKDQDREEDKGQEEVPILPSTKEKGEDEGQGDEVVAEGVEDGFTEEEEPGREREEVSELTLTAGNVRADLGHSGGPTSCHTCTSPSGVFRKAYTSFPSLPPITTAA